MPQWDGGDGGATAPAAEPAALRRRLFGDERGAGAPTCGATVRPRSPPGRGRPSRGGRSSAPWRGGSPAGVHPSSVGSGRPLKSEAATMVLWPTVGSLRVVEVGQFLLAARRRPAMLALDDASSSCAGGRGDAAIRLVMKTPPREGDEPFPGSGVLASLRSRWQGRRHTTCRTRVASGCPPARSDGRRESPLR
jgi:hypothetical protein